jgi:hypothetical protein
MLRVRARVRLLGVCACYYECDGERYGEGAGYDEDHGGVMVQVRVMVRVAVRVHVMVWLMVCVMMRALW